MYNLSLLQEPRARTPLLYCKLLLEAVLVYVTFLDEFRVEIFEFRVTILSFEFKHQTFSGFEFIHQ